MGYVSYRYDFMRHLTLLIFSLLVNASGCSSSVIPKTIQGTWDENDEACKAKHSDTRLLIRPLTIEYWESRGVLLEVLESKNTSLIGRYTFSGEGESWERIITYLLLNEGSELVQAFDDGSQVRRGRCVTGERS